MLISMIMATLGRRDDLNLLFRSLRDQSFDDFELIIVDQNRDGLIDDIITCYEHEFKIIHIKTEIKGLSRARNIGIAHAMGDIVCFPDDDCWLSANTLKQVESKFRVDNIDAITIRALDQNGCPLAKKELKEYEVINRDNIWYGGMSISIFLKTEIAKSIGGFDETLGVGAGTPYGAGEETDFLYRVLDRKTKIIHFQSIEIYHPRKNEKSLSRNLLEKRYYSYGCGIGYVLKKNKANKKKVIVVFLRPMIGALLSFLPGNVAMGIARYNAAKGRIKGYFST